MEVILGVISFCSIVNFGVKSVEFLSDEYEIYNQANRIKKLIVPKPTTKKLYYMQKTKDGNINLKDSEWLIVK